MVEKRHDFGKEDEWMKQKKRIWWTFQLWEADAFQQYLEEMAQQGWFLESVGGSVMKFYQAQPEKRRYVALLVPESSSLTGTDIAKVEQFREQCQEAGWNFQCSGTFWQIFYATDEAAERTGDMSEEKQFQIQKALSWNWSVKILYPILFAVSFWAVYTSLQNPGKLFADPVQLILNPLLLGVSISWMVSYVRLFRWSRGNEMAFKKGKSFPKINLRRKVKLKEYVVILNGILIMAIFILAFSSSTKVLLGNMLSAVLLVGISLFARNWIQNHSSGNSGDDWLSYLVAVAVLAMIIVPLRNAITAHFQEEETDSGKKQTIFASCQTSDFQMSGSGKSVGVTIYTSPIPWIIQKTSKCYPKDLTKYWNQVEQELPTELTELPDGIEVSWYRYLINDDDPAVDEVILKDRGRLVVLDYGGGTDLEGVEEAVETFREGAICVK